MIAVAEPRRTVGTDGFVRVEVAMLGGRVGVHLGGMTDETGARLAARATVRRIAAWSSHLTRFEATSDLCRLNADAADDVALPPTLAAVLDWGRAAEAVTDGIVNIAMLDERLAAELGSAPGAAGGGRAPAEIAARRWSLSRGGRRTLVHRPVGVRFDLDGVAKGWLADRALGALRGYAVAVVDADGDVAVRLAAGETCAIGIADPARRATNLVVLLLQARLDVPATGFGIATSGTSVHRWRRDEGQSHHLIDPRSGRPAVTDVVQATVVARTARLAEAFAKTAVILGTDAALAVLDRSDVEGAVLLTAAGRLVLTPGAERLVA